MLVHDDKGVQLESFLLLQALESFPKKPGIGFDHEQAPALPGREVTKYVPGGEIA
jgi:hypothetical protein